MTASLDTNILLRYILEDAPHQCEKVKKLILNQEQPFYISDLVLAEVVFNLQGTKMPRKNIVSILSRLFDLPNVHVNHTILDQALPFYEDHPALSFVDCMAAAYAKAENKTPLWTFDRKLANQHPSAKLLA